MLAGLAYQGIDDRGLTVRHGEQVRLLEVDAVVLCTGQESQRELVAPLQAAGVAVHVIGGADVAVELDAKRAIAQGTRLAAAL
jgi:2,4-dienoyl-CoA reductase (NADPH2)